MITERKDETLKGSCHENGIFLFENLKMICKEKKARKLNTLNKKSLVLRFSDIDNIEEFEDIEFYDNKGNKVLDISLYFPCDKAYIILNRVHFGKLYENNKKNIMKQFINYLLSPNNFKFVTSAIYLNIVDFGVKEYILEKIGFFSYGPIGTNILCRLNTNFMRDISSISIDDETKNHILKCYKSLNKTKNKYLYRVKLRLATSETSLKSLIKEKRTGKIIEFQKDNINHYKEILSNYINY